MSETEPLVSTETASTDAGARTAVDAEEIAAEQATVPRRRTSLWARPSYWVPPILLLAGIIGVVYLIGALLGTRSYLMPQPHVIFAVYTDPKTGPEIFEALWNTAQVALVGLVIAIVIGVVWAVAMNLAKWVERTTFPYAVILQSIPILAVVPLIGFWFGYDFIARTIVCVLIALFPIVSNTLFGLQSVDRGARELFQLQKATRWIVLRKLELPTALPAMFAGMRISAGLSIVGAIVGDFFFQRGTPGIGALIAKYQSRLQSPELFASILLASLFGVVIFLFFGWLARRAVGKWYDFG
ncbi:ABC transporter permease [Microbacterium sp. F2E]|uniref:ABC transporter permease n=1 Tax=Microbacterium TaxID=33882 RepID=UPI0019C818F7|nr:MULTISPECIES: ABC transporter permease [Microbacterium]MBD3756616.1 ABC transporter permease [Microbacterium sp.]MCC9053953.1 ABC transporter permease [Microbacterium sp. F2E]